MFYLYMKLFQFLLKTSLFIRDVYSLLIGPTKSMKIELPRNIMILQYQHFFQL